MMAVGNAPAHCEPHPGPLIFSATVQPLKYSEDFFQVFLLESNPIILNIQLAELLARNGSKRPRV